MDAEALRRTLETGPHRGSTAGAARSTGRRARRPGTASTSARCAWTATATPSSCWSTSTGAGACHTGERTLLLPDHRDGPGGARAVTPGGGPSPSRARARSASAPTPPSSPRWPRSTRIVPVWCEVVADTLTPVACFANVVGEERRVPLRVGRGRRALGPLLVRRAPPAGHADGAGADGRGRRGGSGLEPLRRRDPGRGRGAWWRASSRRRWPACRRCTGAWSGTSATTWCARSSGCPHPPADDLGHPDAALVVIGQFCAFDHWRQRVVLVDNVVVPEAPDGVVDAEAVGAAYEAAVRAAGRAGRGLRPAGRGAGAPMVAAPPPGSRRPRRRGR